MYHYTCLVAGTGLHMHNDHIIYYEIVMIKCKTEQ